MYLSELTEKEKKMFLGLAYAVSCADSDVSNKEKDTIEQYCEEMNIEKPSFFENTADIIEKISATSNLQSKKIIVFELVGLAIIDSNYNKVEKDLIEKIATNFGLENDFVKNCYDIINEYLIFQDKVNNFVLD